MLTGTLAQIDSFGAVGAEDDETLLDYFLSTPAVNQIESGKKMLVLGRKGSGKTALVRYFGNKTSDDDIHISLRLGQYPWNVHAQRKTQAPQISRSTLLLGATLSPLRPYPLFSEDTERFS